MYYGFLPESYRNIMHLKSHIKQTKISTQRGFTLLELLLSMVIIMVIGSVILTIFFSALRGSDKAQSLITLRQKGNFALTQMVKSIRFSENIANFSACSTSQASTELQIVSSSDHEVTTYSCGNGNIASSSATKTYFLLETNNNITLKACSFTCGVQQPSFTPYATISFNLVPTSKKDSTSPDVLQQFKTTVFLRNAIE